MIYDINGNKLYTNNQLDALSILSEDRYNAINASNIKCAFLTLNGDVWMVKETGTCYVVSNGSIVKTITLDHTVGHANNANYVNGFAYISDWTDGTLLHVFEIDENARTAAYVKDIVIDTGHGRSQFWVKSEDEVVSCGWDIEHSTNSNYMIIGLWKKDRSGSYVNAWELPAIGVNMVQGFCVKENLAYIINNTTSYKHSGLVVVDMATGFQKIETSQTGAVTTVETESIIPVSDNSFLVVCGNGRQFTFTEVYG